MADEGDMSEMEDDVSEMMDGVSEMGDPVLEEEASEEEANGSSLDSDDSSSNSSSSSSSSSSDSSDAEMPEAELPAPNVAVATAEQLQEALRIKGVLQGLTLENEVAKVKEGYIMVEEMSKICELGEAGKECLQKGLEIASHHGLGLIKVGDFDMEILALPLEERKGVFETELGLWRQRLDVLAVQEELKKRRDNIFNQTVSGLSPPMRRGYNMLACRELEFVLRRRETGGLEGTSLGSLESLVSFALNAWQCMEPHPSELVDTCLQSSPTAEQIRRWLEEEACLESLVKWRLLRAARSERLSAEDSDLSTPAKVVKTAAKRQARN